MISEVLDLASKAFSTMWTFWVRVMVGLVKYDLKSLFVRMIWNTAPGDQADGRWGGGVGYILAWGRRCFKVCWQNF